MLFVNPLSSTEIATLEEAYRHHPLNATRTRAHCIILSDKEYAIKEISDICGICRQSVSTAIHNWESYGFAGLIDAPRSGRPRKITPEQQEYLINQVQESPRSLKRVLSEFSETHGITLSINTLKRMCKEAHMSWKRVRKSLRSKRNNEEFERSKALINQLIESYKAGEINLYYFDESGFSLTPTVPYAWQKIGEYIEIPSSRSPALNVLAFIDRDSVCESFIFTGTVNTDVVIGVFDDFCKNIDKATVVLVDNAPTHTSDKFDKKTIEWCEKGLIVVPISRYSPELNIAEILWRKIKYEWMPFSAYVSFDSLKKELSNILANIGKQYIINFS